MLKKIALEKFGDLVAALMEKGPLYAPVKSEKAVDFREIKNPGDATLDFYNTAMSPKFMFFPQSEDIIRYKLGKDAKGRRNNKMEAWIIEWEAGMKGYRTGMT